MNERRHGVIWDFDGVLADTEGLQYRSYATVLAEWDVRIDEEEYGREWIGAGRGPEYAVRRYGLDVSADELRRRKDPIYFDLLQNEIELMPGAREALDRLSARFALVVATNSNARDTNYLLDRFGVRDYFDDVVTRERYSERKPAPDAFLAAARAVSLAPSECVVLEDATKGVLAARRAGCPCIALPNRMTRNNDFSDATLVLDGLDRVTPDIVLQLLSS